MPEVQTVQQLLERAFTDYPRVVLSCCLQAFKAPDKGLYHGANWFCKHQLLSDRPVPAGEDGEGGEGEEGEEGGAQQDGAQPRAAGEHSGQGQDGGREAKEGVGDGPGWRRGSEPGELPQAQGDGGGSRAGSSSGQAPGSTGPGLGSSSKWGPVANGGTAPGGGLPSAGEKGKKGAGSAVTCLAKQVLSELPDTQQWLRTAIVSISKGGWGGFSLLGPVVHARVGGGRVARPALRPEPHKSLPVHASPAECQRLVTMLAWL